MNKRFILLFLLFLTLLTVSAQDKKKKFAPDINAMDSLLRDSRRNWSNI